ncbi:EAL domain-containing protein [Psychromonas sp. RZ22]|uniref:EAL domain-containing protein n=1 Tax=Psychromonas algarum TaxID=2555643 RepID=UPI0010675534|nr:EAL domain-containing protein [Psychromonas sp. RZ22]TEW56098.1 EAL domain-containing protein [Psychromonas sp. RZ22]
MNDYKISLWLTNIITIIIAISLAFAIKLIFNPLLYQQQQLTGENEQFTQLPDLVNLDELRESINLNQFTYIKVSGDNLSKPIIYTKKSEHDLFSKILPLPLSTSTSVSNQQTFEYTSTNDSLFKLYRSIVLIIIAGLILTMIIANFIYFRLFKKIEHALVYEITNDVHKETPFTRVSDALHEQKLLIHQALQKQESKIVELAEQVNTDNLTGLHNRHAFRKELIQILTHESNPKSAILFIIRSFELSAINAKRGFQQGDQYIIDIAQMIKKGIERYKNIHISHINGADFALIAHEMSIKDAHQLAKELKLKFDEYQQFNNLDNVAFNGMTVITSNQLPEQVLTRADIALAKAQLEGVNAWVFEPKDNENVALGQQYWTTLIKDIIDKRSLTLLSQPIQEIHREMKAYQEIFTRFTGENNNIIPTENVFAMALRTDNIIKLEQIIIEKVISKYRVQTSHHCRWGLNISSSAIQSSSFNIWLERLLLRNPDIAGSLVFEMQEKLLDNNLITSKRFFEMLKRVGSRSAICNFGKGIGSFRLFKELKPNFVKIDASLIRHIESDSENQQFVRMVIDVAHRMDCQVIAEGIEDIEQKQILESMHVDGIQGYLIAHPTVL